MATLNVGSMAARLGLDASEFMDKMKGVQGFNGFMSGEMSRQWRDTQREGAESMRLIDEAIGVHISKPLTRLLTSEFPALASGLQTILGASAFGALASVGVEAVDKAEKSIEKAMHAQEEWRMAIAKTEATIESVADSYARKISTANGIDSMIARAMAGADEAKSAFDKVSAAIDEEDKKALEAQGTWTAFKAFVGDTWHEIFTSDAGLDTEKLQGQLGTLKTEIQEAFRLDALHGTHDAMTVFQRDLELSTQKLRELKEQQAKQSAAPPPSATLWRKGKEPDAPGPKVTPEQIAAVEQWVNLLEHAKTIEQDRENLEKADSGAAARAQALRDEATAQERVSALYKEMGSSLAKLQPETDPIKKLDAEIAGFRSAAENSFRAIGQSAASALATSAAMAGLDAYEKKLDLVKGKLEADIYAKQALDLLDQTLAGAKQKSTALPPQLSTAPAMPTLGAGGSAAAQLDRFGADQAAQLKMAAQAYQDALTPQDKYKLGQQELQLLVSKGLIDQQAYTAAMAQLDTQIVKAADSAHKLQTELEKMLERSTDGAAGLKAWALQIQIAAAENGKFVDSLMMSATGGAEDNAIKSFFDMLDQQRGGQRKLISDLEKMWAGYFQNLASMSMKNAMDKIIAPLLPKPQSGDPSTSSQSAKTGAGGMLASIFGVAKPAAAGANGTSALNTAGLSLSKAAAELTSAAMALRASASTGSMSGGGGGGASAGSFFSGAGNADAGDTPFYAAGGDATPGSSFISGEAGAEEVNLDGRGGAHITPLGLSEKNGDTHIYNDFSNTVMSEDLMRRAEGIAAIHASEGRMMSVIPALQREVLLRNRIQR